MRNSILIGLGLILALSSGCKKEEPLMDTADLMDAEVLYSGSFSDAAHETSGMVRVERDDNQTILSFKDFKTDSGPDLFVYLSTDETDDDFINLGELKSISGDFYYELDNQTDLVKFDHVLIWCKQFSVLFGSAELK